MLGLAGVPAAVGVWKKEQVGGEGKYVKLCEIPRSWE